jgi:DNA-binding XRE family transcriptional regulator
VSSNVKTIRQAQQKLRGDQFTQEAVALAIGVHRVTYVRFESGKAVPDVIEAQRLARYLGVSIEQLGFEEVREGE